MLLFIVIVGGIFLLATMSENHGQAFDEAEDRGDYDEADEQLNRSGIALALAILFGLLFLALIAAPAGALGGG